MITHKYERGIGMFSSVITQSKADSLTSGNLGLGGCHCQEISLPTPHLLSLGLLIFSWVPSLWPEVLAAYKEAERKGRGLFFSLLEFKWHYLVACALSLVETVITRDMVGVISSQRRGRLTDCHEYLLPKLIAAEKITAVWADASMKLISCNPCCSSVFLLAIC